MPTRQVKVFEKDGKLLARGSVPGSGHGQRLRRQGRRPGNVLIRSRATPRRRRSTATTCGTGENREVFAPKVNFDPADYTTEQVFYPSKDGTRIPMCISYKKGLQTRRGQSRPCSTATADLASRSRRRLSPANLAWMEMGGIYAVPNLRGGGEYGEDWHQAGTKAAQAERFRRFHRRRGVADRQQVHFHAQTGGLRAAATADLLVGAVLTQRPDLFGAALPAVGVMDMLRFQKFTIGWGWASDYGSSDDPEQFKSLYAYSPLHHLRPGVHYPPTLVTTSDHDDRVVPGAQLQIRGHAAGRPGRRRPGADPHRNEKRPRGGGRYRPPS